MSWIFENKIVTEAPIDAVGYVYLITNNITGRKYVGKKLFSFSKTTYKVVKLKNGTKKRKKIRSQIESDWQEYWSSCDELKKDVHTLDSDNFSREILMYCSSKSELSYYEAKFQFEYDVLLNPIMWYNGWISVRVRRNQLK